MGSVVTTTITCTCTGINWRLSCIAATFTIIITSTGIIRPVMNILQIAFLPLMVLLEVNSN